MRRGSQFAKIYEQRIADLEITQFDSTRRWAVWNDQQRCGSVTCFRTDVRYSCEKTNCAWRAECMTLRAEWKR